VVGDQWTVVSLAKSLFMNCHPEPSKGLAVARRLRKWALATVCVTATAFANAEDSSPTRDWRTFSRLCGRLEYMWTVPEGRQHKILVEHRKPLSKILLELFPWREGVSCCSDLTLVESVTTKRDGSFDFTSSSPGKYFVVAHWKGAHRLETEITRSNGQQDDCTAQGLDIDESGRLDKFLTIKLD
jgi:hypothetical protein